MKTRQLFVVLVLVVGSLSLNAAEEKTMPSPDIARVQKFVGNWSGTTSVNITGGPSGNGTAAMHVTSVGGNAVMGDISFNVEAVGNFSGNWEMGVDHDTGLTHLFIVTNSSAAHDHTGTWLNDNTLVLHTMAKSDGVLTTEDFTCTFVSPNEMRIDERDNMENGGSAYFSTTLKKK